jgi:hypothetical protein
MRIPRLAFVVVASSSVVAAQGLLDLGGTWLGSCSDCAPNAMPDGFARTLIIRVAESEITIQQGARAAEVYRLDGTETTLPDGRTATAMIEDGGLVLTTVRTRARSRDEVFVT